MSRGDPCTANTVSSPAPVPVLLPGTMPGTSASTGVNSPPQLRSADKRMAWHIVSIDGEPLTGSYEKLITMIRIKESADHLLSTAEVSIYNKDHQYTDDAKFTQYKKLEISCGFASEGLVKRETFITLQPQFVFPSRKGEYPLIKLFAVGQEVLMSRTEKRRTWHKMRESEVAEKIAAEYGWGTDVQDTGTLLDEICQSATTDWHLLDKLARSHGYSLYVENDVLHFHAPRYRNSGIEVAYTGNAAQLTGFTVQGETLHSGVKMRFSQVDPLKKEPFEVTSQEQEDEITKTTVSDYGKPVKKAKELASNDSEQPEQFIYDEGQQQTKEYLQKLVEGFSQHTRWLMQGEGEIIGLEQLKPRDTLEVMGVGKHSGKYYVTDTEHVILGGNYMTKFHVARTWEGAGDGSTNIGSQTVSLAQVTS